MLRRVPLRLALLLVVVAVWAAAAAAGLRGIQSSPAYSVATSLLLGIGLYGSTASIDRAGAAAHKKIILWAITVGVLLKAAVIGGVLYLVTRDPVFFVLGVAVAQIDPLSVATLMGDDRMSARAKSILAAWASFDDPMTVLLAVYASALVRGDHGLGGGVGRYALDLAFNLGLAALAIAAWRVLRERRVVVTVVFVALLVVAVWQFLMLAIAIVGLFVRPAWLVRRLPSITNGALLVSGGVLGLLLVNGVHIREGLLLGLMAFVAQAVAAALLTRRLPATDRTHLALAQQNGITAIILGLRLEVPFPGAIGVIAPAILVTNITHYLANRVADRRSRARAANRPAL
jgi:hypothetical protein